MLQIYTFVLAVTHSVENARVEFTWKRQRLFDLTAAQIYHDRCVEEPIAKVDSVSSKPKSKWRPLPMDTIVRWLILLKLATEAASRKIVYNLYFQICIAHKKMKQNNVQILSMNFRSLKSWRRKSFGFRRKRR